MVERSNHKFQIDSITKKMLIKSNFGSALSTVDYSYKTKEEVV